LAPRTRATRLGNERYSNRRNLAFAHHAVRRALELWRRFRMSQIAEDRLTNRDKDSVGREIEALFGE
jgi:hypothetical protein